MSLHYLVKYVASFWLTVANCRGFFCVTLQVGRCHIRAFERASVCTALDEFDLLFQTTLFLRRR